MQQSVNKQSNVRRTSSINQEDGLCFTPCLFVCLFVYKLLKQLSLEACSKMDGRDGKLGQRSV